MSKRKNRDRAPNIPQETLERARQQAEIAENVEQQNSKKSDIAPSEAAARVQETLRVSETSGLSREQRRAAQGVNPARRRPASSGLPDAAPRPRRKRNADELTVAEIEELLANPTKTVTEAELHAHYGYVLKDLRNMGILAAASFIFLIVLAQIL